MTGLLAGKVIVITGAASGIGRACAIRYAAEGASVVASDVDEGGLGGTVEAIRDGGGEAIAVRCDVAECEEIDHLLASAVDRFGKVDVWHNNAFRSVFRPITEQTLDEFDDTIAVCLRAYWYGAKIAVEHMLGRGRGVICNTASVQSYRGASGFSAYMIAKHGILGLTRSIGVDHAPAIRAVAVAPGLIHTPAHDGIPAETLAAVASEIPARRGAEPAEVAALAAFLVSDQADYINATGVVIDGGYLAI